MMVEMLPAIFLQVSRAASRLVDVMAGFGD
jgi:hypothetical protein